MKPLLSVLTVTYNHEAFIAETIEGILNQEVNFLIEVIVADDCSPDNTSAVVSSICSSHPNGSAVKYTRHPKNIGGTENFLWAMGQCKGKYIAHCEGDDYWTDPHKLQTQVDFLEKNSTFSFCFHQIDRVDPEGKVLVENYSPANFFEPETDFSSKRILAYDMLINTCSLLYRNNELLIHQMRGGDFLPYGDKTLEKLLALQGNGYFFRKSMACYRMNPNSLTQTTTWRNYGKENRYKDYIELFKYLKRVTNSEAELNLLDRVIERCKHRFNNNEFLWFFSPNSIRLTYIYSGKRVSKFFKYYSKELYLSFKRFVLKRVLKRS